MIVRNVSFVVLTVPVICKPCHLVDNGSHDLSALYPYKLLAQSALQLSKYLVTQHFCLKQNTPLLCVVIKPNLIMPWKFKGVPLGNTSDISTSVQGGVLHQIFSMRKKNPIGSKVL